MSKKANTTFIGAFILGAIALAIGVVITFGSINFLKKRPVGVSYFPGDAGGLNVGAAVNLHGVRIGSVTNIDVQADPRTALVRVAVYQEFEPERLVIIGESPSYVIGSGEGIRQAVDKGLTAQLASESLVTGQLSVELSFERGAGQKADRRLKADEKIPEIPTVPSEIEQLKNMITRLPVDRLLVALEKTADSANRLMNSPELPELLRSFVEVSHDANTLIDSAHEQFKPVIAAALDTLADAQKTLDQMRSTLGTADQVVGSNVPATLKAAEVAMQQASVTLNGANSLVTANSPQRADIDQVLRNMAAASRALRLLSEQLERKPNSIVLGK